MLEKALSIAIAYFLFSSVFHLSLFSPSLHLSILIHPLSNNSAQYRVE